jgi:hypothetical protein
MWYSECSIKRKQHFVSLIATLLRSGQPLRCGCCLPPNLHKRTNRLLPMITQEVAISINIGCPLRGAEKSRAFLLPILLQTPIQHCRPMRIAA